MTLGGKSKPITLEMDRSLWASFKKKVPRPIKLNDKVVSLIEGFVNKK